MMIGGGAYGTFPPPSPDGKRSMDKAKKKQGERWKNRWETSRQEGGSAGAGLCY